MANEVPGWTLGELAERLGGELCGPEGLRIRRAGTPDSDDPEALTFAESDTYLAQALAGPVGAVLVGPDADPGEKAAIRVPSPRQAFGQFLAICRRPLPIESGVHPMAVVSPDAILGEGVSVGAFAVVEQGAEIGTGSRIYSFAYVGENCRLGEGCTLYPHSVLYQDVTLGARSIIHSGAVLGADGFGYAWDGSRRVKIPQVGAVVLGDEVEIGANTTIDRATAGATVVGTGTKLDNLVQVGHNCRIGEHTVVAGLSGISGSTKIGSRNTLAGQVATADHVTVCDDVTLAGRTGVTNDIKEPGAYFGFPARPLGEAMRSLVLVSRLQDLFARVRKLEREKGI